ncbi:hypothetical protein A0H76_1676 [Hepatospora eriocheir]|uniref:Nucleoporin NSP1-like C-terminal domain-containing protein n=1 Tax=Hepatospora eriocheir TaxID=1081669 RepID=A0A1X0QGN1_9MICR|nr:hypothetical protein A0H76_1676 [Hepatospora eriocheir]
MVFNENPFNQQNKQDNNTVNPFGTNNQSNNNPFNTNNQTNNNQTTNPFNQTINPFSTNQTTTTPFSNQTTTTPFSTINNNNPFNTTNQISNNNPFGNQTTTPFSNQTTNQIGNQTSNPFSTNQTTNPISTNNQISTNNPFSNQTTTNTINQTSILGSTSNNEVPFSSNNQSMFNIPNKPNVTLEQNSNTTILDNNTSAFVSSIKDSTSGLYNLSVKEIIDKQTEQLNENINRFREDAKEIFEQDMKLITLRSNYVTVQKKIEDENLKLDELLEALDYFSNELDKKNNDSVVEEVKVEDVIGTFEEISEKFTRKVETFKDENHGVLDLFNECYDLIERNDKKLDALSNSKGMF